MTSPTLNCRDERRRHEVRRRQANGLDYVEVSDDQRELTVYFLGPAPEGLGPENFRITGGRRARDLRVTRLRLCPRTDPELDNCIVLTVDRPGDFSTYTLCLVDLPEDSPFDPRYRCLEFGFKAACPTELDCRAERACPPEPGREPEISYLAKDYASFRRLILDRLAVVMPEWTERHVPDVGITLVELLAYVGDHLSYYQDAVATEAYLDTARQRISVRRHARLVDYPMHEGCNARAWVHFDTSTDLEGEHAIPAAELWLLTRFEDAHEPDGRVLGWNDLRAVPPHRYEVFEPLVADRGARLEFHEAHNRIRLYTWGDRECCLPRGATAATLVDGGPVGPPVVKEAEEERPEDVDAGQGEEGADHPAGLAGPAAARAAQPADMPAEEAPDARRVLRLRPGDVLILEEVLGPRTGVAADADAQHRHAVRLTRVERTVDPLYGQPLLEVEWAEEDALPFALCLSALGPPPECAMLEDVSVARGNVVLVDHGRRRGPESLGAVPAEPDATPCEREGRPAEVTRRAGRFRPVLSEGPLTFGEPAPGDAPAVRALDQDPRRALPRLRVWSGPQGRDDDGGHHPVSTREWESRADLLASGAEDRHFVVEMDERRRAHLRFGDGELGLAPEADHAFRSEYRVGSGPSGNVGREAIAIAVTAQPVSGIELRPRNPLPARGGTSPEPTREVKLFAPHAFRGVLERAVTADDYARLAERHPNVDRAAAVLRWNGSWHVAVVAIDPLGRTDADAALLEELERFLYRFRRIGHDLAVRLADFVPIDLELKVCVRHGVLRGHVKAALLERFANRRLPDGSPGFFHPDALSFGDGIAVSRIVAAAQEVAGVESVTVTRLDRLFARSGDALERGVLRIGDFEIARLDNDPSLPENGRLRFDLRGGR